MLASYFVDTDGTCFNVKTEADSDCMILEYPHDKSTVGMLLASLHSFICLRRRRR